MTNRARDLNRSEIHQPKSRLDADDSYRSFIGYKNPVLSSIAKKMLHGDYSSNATTTERLPDINRRNIHNEYNSFDLNNMTPNIGSVKHSVS